MWSVFIWNQQWHFPIRIRVHRCVLYSASAYFKTLFAADAIEQDAKEVELNEVHGTILSQLVDYCYTLRVTINVTNAVDLMTAAHLFQLDDVVKQCEIFCATQIAAPNAFDYMVLAKKHALPILRKAACKFVQREFEAVVEGWSFIELSIDEVVEYLGDDNIVVDSEHAVFDAAVKWIEASRNGRRQHYPKLMGALRMSKIDYTVRIWATTR